jgi:hypothetical protein
MPMIAATMKQAISRPARGRAALRSSPAQRLSVGQ